MSQQQNTQAQVPADLIEQMGTYADTAAASAVIGKAVRVTEGPAKEAALKYDGAPFIIRVMALGHAGYKGAEGKVIHVDAEGELWADFGDDKGIARGPEGVRIIDVGRIEEFDGYEFV